MAKKINQHLLLLSLVRSDIVNDFPDLKTKLHNALLRMIFRNYRAGKGIHLSEFGFTYMSKKIKFWSFELGENKPTTKHFIFLERSEKYPYYYQKDNIFFTACPNLAMLLKLSPHPDSFMGVK